MQVERNCGMGYPYQPIMAPMMPFNQNTNMLEQRLSDIERRLSILEANLNGQKIASNSISNYQMI